MTSIKVLMKRKELVDVRLEAYLKKEQEILDGGVQAYGIGSRNLTRYNADLATIRGAIEELLAEKDELEALIDGRCRRKSVGVVMRDW